MFELLLNGFGAVFSLDILVLGTLGVAVGIIFGAVPGLTAVMAIALCLPLTFTMGPAAGLSLLVALYIGATSGGLIAAILLKIPGTPSSIATTFDGGPMMDKGEGIKALGVGVVFSFLGTIFSIVALIFIAPWLAKVALSFGPHEYFGIAIFSLTLIATLSSGSMVKGLFAGAIPEAVFLEDVERRLGFSTRQPFDIVAKSGAHHLCDDEHDDEQRHPEAQHGPAVAIVETR